MTTFNMNYDRNLHSLRISCDPMTLWYYRIIIKQLTIKKKLKENLKNTDFHIVTDNRNYHSRFLCL